MLGPSSHTKHSSTNPFGELIGEDIFGGFIAEDPLLRRVEGRSDESSEEEEDNSSSSSYSSRSSSISSSADKNESSTTSTSNSHVIGLSKRKDKNGFKGKNINNNLQRLFKSDQKTQLMGRRSSSESSGSSTANEYSSLSNRGPPTAPVAETADINKKDDAAETRVNLLVLRNKRLVGSGARKHSKSSASSSSSSSSTTNSEELLSPTTQNSNTENENNQPLQFGINFGKESSKQENIRENDGEREREEEEEDANGTPLTFDGKNINDKRKEARQHDHDGLLLRRSRGDKSLLRSLKAAVGNAYGCDNKVRTAKRGLMTEEEAVKMELREEQERLTAKIYANELLASTAAQVFATCHQWGSLPNPNKSVNSSDGPTVGHVHTAAVPNVSVSKPPTVTTRDNSISNNSYIHNSNTTTNDNNNNIMQPSLHPQQPPVTPRARSSGGGTVDSSRTAQNQLIDSCSSSSDPSTVGGTPVVVTSAEHDPFPSSSSMNDTAEGPPANVSARNKSFSRTNAVVVGGVLAPPLSPAPQTALLAAATATPIATAAGVVLCRQRRGSMLTLNPKEQQAVAAALLRSREHSFAVSNANGMALAESCNTVTNGNNNNNNNSNNNFTPKTASSDFVRKQSVVGRGGSMSASTPLTHAHVQASTPHPHNSSKHSLTRASGGAGGGGGQVCTTNGTNIHNSSSLAAGGGLGLGVGSLGFARSLMLPNTSGDCTGVGVGVTSTSTDGFYNGLVDGVAPPMMVSASAPCFGEATSSPAPPLFNRSPLHPPHPSAHQKSSRSQISGGSRSTSKSGTFPGLTSPFPESGGLPAAAIGPYKGDGAGDISDQQRRVTSPTHPLSGFPPAASLTRGPSSREEDDGAAATLTLPANANVISNFLFAADGSHSTSSAIPGTAAEDLIAGMPEGEALEDAELLTLFGDQVVLDADRNRMHAVKGSCSPALSASLKLGLTSPSIPSSTLLAPFIPAYHQAGAAQTTSQSRLRAGTLLFIAQSNILNNSPFHHTHISNSNFHHHNNNTNASYHHHYHHHHHHHHHQESSILSDSASCSLSMNNYSTSTTLTSPPLLPRGAPPLSSLHPLSRSPTTSPSSSAPLSSPTPKVSSSLGAGGGAATRKKGTRRAAAAAEKEKEAAAAAAEATETTLAKALRVKTVLERAKEQYYDAIIDPNTHRCDLMQQMMSKEGGQTAALPEDADIPSLAEALRRRTYVLNNLSVIGTTDVRPIVRKSFYSTTLDFMYCELSKLPMETLVRPLAPPPLATLLVMEAQYWDSKLPGLLEIPDVAELRKTIERNGVAFPKFVFPSIASVLVELNISNNRLTELPENIGVFSALKKLSARSNRIASVPPSLCMCEELVTLDLSNNLLVALPDDLEELNNLETLVLDYNRFDHLPRCVFQGMVKLKKLCIIDNSALVRLNCTPMGGNTQLDTDEAWAAEEERKKNLKEETEDEALRRWQETRLTRKAVVKHQTESFENARRILAPHVASMCKEASKKNQPFRGGHQPLSRPNYGVIEAVRSRSVSKVSGAPSPTPPQTTRLSLTAVAPRLFMEPEVFLSRSGENKSAVNNNNNNDTNYNTNLQLQPAASFGPPTLLQAAPPSSQLPSVPSRTDLSSTLHPTTATTTDGVTEGQATEPHSSLSTLTLAPPNSILLIPQPPTTTSISTITAESPATAFPSVVKCEACRGSTTDDTPRRGTEGEDEGDANGLYENCECECGDNEDASSPLLSPTPSPSRKRLAEALASSNSGWASQSSSPTNQHPPNGHFNGSFFINSGSLSPRDRRVGGGEEERDRTAVAALSSKSELICVAMPDDNSLERANNNNNSNHSKVNSTCCRSKNCKRRFRLRMESPSQLSSSGLRGGAANTSAILPSDLLKHLLQRPLADPLFELEIDNAPELMASYETLRKLLVARRLETPQRQILMNVAEDLVDEAGYTSATNVEGPIGLSLNSAATRADQFKAAVREGVASPLLAVQKKASSGLDGSLREVGNGSFCASYTLRPRSVVKNEINSSQGNSVGRRVETPSFGEPSGMSQSQPTNGNTNNNSKFSVNTLFSNNSGGGVYSNVVLQNNNGSFFNTSNLSFSTSHQPQHSHTPSVLLGVGYSTPAAANRSVATQSMGASTTSISASTATLVVSPGLVPSSAAAINPNGPLIAFGMMSIDDDKRLPSRLEDHPSGHAHLENEGTYAPPLRGGSPRHPTTVTFTLSSTSPPPESSNNNNSKDIDAFASRHLHAHAPHQQTIVTPRSELSINGSVPSGCSSFANAAFTYHVSSMYGLPPPPPPPARQMTDDTDSGSKEGSFTAGGCGVISVEGGRSSQCLTEGGETNTCTALLSKSEGLSLLDGAFGSHNNQSRPRGLSHLSQSSGHSVQTHQTASNSLPSSLRGVDTTRVHLCCASCGAAIRPTSGHNQNSKTNQKSNCIIKGEITCGKSDKKNAIALSRAPSPTPSSLSSAAPLVQRMPDPDFYVSSLVRVSWNKTWPDDIAASLCLGSLRTVQNLETLHALGITHVLTCGRNLDTPIEFLKVYATPPGGVPKGVSPDGPLSSGGSTNHLKKKKSVHGGIAAGVPITMMSIPPAASVMEGKQEKDETKGREDDDDSSPLGDTVAPTCTSADSPTSSSATPVLAPGAKIQARRHRGNTVASHKPSIPFAARLAAANLAGEVAGAENKSSHLPSSLPSLSSPPLSSEVAGSASERKGSVVVTAVPGADMVSGSGQAESSLIASPLMANEAVVEPPLIDVERDHTGNPRIKQLVLEVDDNESEALSPYFYQAIDFIEDSARCGGKTLVHCFAGVSRSATVVVAYVMHKQGMPAREALEYVQKKRPCANPNYNFRNQLLRFEKLLKKEGTIPSQQK